MFKQLAKQLMDASRDQKYSLFIEKSIRIAIQLGNDTSLSGTLSLGDYAEVFYDACM